MAEVASTCNEALLIRYLLKQCKEKKERAYLLNHFLESFRATLFRQTMFAEFEKTVHELGAAGESLTSEKLCGIYQKLNEDYFGPDMVSDSEIGYEWERIPHFIHLLCISVRNRFFGCRCHQPPDHGRGAGDFRGL